MKNFNIVKVAFFRTGCCVLLLFCGTIHSKAQQLIGGEFSSSSDGTIVTFYVTTYSLNAPNSEATLEYGDGGFSILELSSVMINDSVYQNNGSAIHIFIGTGIYRVTCTSDYILADVRNVEDSATKKLLMDVLFYYDNTLVNTSPVHTNSIFDFVVSDACYVTHAENATDADGDSLVYTTTLFQVYGGDAFSDWPDAADSLGIDTSGLFYWRNAIYRDRYAIQFETSDYRDGQLTGETERKIIIPVNCGIVASADFVPSALRLCPNPVRDILHAGLPNNAPFFYTIYDASGNSIMQNVFTASPYLQVQTLKPGMYVLYIQQQEGNLSTTFCKQ